MALQEIGRGTRMPGVRRVGLALAAMVSIAALSAEPAQARHHGHARHHAPAKKATPKPEAVKEPTPVIYSDERDCVAKKALDAPLCHNAFVNARAEYEEKAPRFDSKVPCARFFGAANCAMRISSALSGVTFLPSFGGFTLSKEKDGATMVRPVLASKTTPVDFSPRPVATLDTEQDAKRGQRAIAAWRAKHDTAPRAPGGGNAMSYRAAPKDTMFDEPTGGDVAPLPGPAQTYPVNPAMMQRIEDEMRKYGTPPRK
jgi:uncharacterized protein YgiB involved in biofilm formation